MRRVVIACLGASATVGVGGAGVGGVGVAGVGVGGVGVGGVVVGAGVAGAATRHSRPPARMLVYAQEWTMYGSRASVPAGRVIVQLWNRGQDPHNLHIRRLNARGQMTGPAQALRTTPSGVISEAAWRLGKGKYELYCSLPQHLQRGMHTRLTVR